MVNKLNTYNSVLFYTLSTILLLFALLFSCTEKKTIAKSPLQALPIKQLPPPIIKTAIQYDYDTTLWTDIALVAPSIRIDMRYATTDNFVKEKMYNCGRCFLRPAVAHAVVKAHQYLQKQQLGLKMLDCYRPKPIQQKLWDKVPNASYVTPPWRGSMHNKGAAIDVTIVDENGMQLDMGTTYDFFGKKAHHTYKNLPEKILKNRALLKSTMEKFGLRPIRTEWWHYSYQRKKYTISDMVWNCLN